MEPMTRERREEIRAANEKRRDLFRLAAKEPWHYHVEDLACDCADETVDDLLAEVERLTAERDALAQDAARWKFVVRHAACKDGDVCPICIGILAANPDNTHELTAAVDAAIAKEKQA